MLMGQVQWAKRILFESNLTGPVVIENNEIGTDSDTPIFRNIQLLSDSRTYYGKSIDRPITLKNNELGIASGASIVYRAYAYFDKDNAVPSGFAGKVGDITFNSEPSTGEDAGWICTVAADPVNKTVGTWKSIGKVL